VEVASSAALLVLGAQGLGVCRFLSWSSEYIRRSWVSQLDRHTMAAIATNRREERRA